MGGVPGTLLCFWCKGGCSTAKVAGALTFFPPEPHYTLQKDPNNPERLIFRVHEDLQPLPFDNVEAQIVTTRRRKNIPVVLYRYRNAKYTLIFSHGNATDLGAMHDRFVGLAMSLQINIVGYDYTGYGHSHDTCTEGDTYADLEAVFDWVVKNVAPQPETSVILYGQSVGSGPTCWLARKQKTAGIVLHSPFMSGMRVLTSNRCLACLDIYPNLSRVAEVQCPVLVIHGQEDREVDWSHGVNLWNTIPDKFRVEPWWVPERGHNNICQGQTALREYHRRLRVFIDGLEKASGSADA